MSIIEMNKDADWQGKDRILNAWDKKVKVIPEIGSVEEGGAVMATSSIFYNFTITDEKDAERFANALEQAAQQPAWKPQTTAAPLVRDPDTIRAIANRAITAKRNTRNGK